MSVSFRVQGNVAVVIGRAGVLCAAMCHELAAAGAQVAVLAGRGGFSAFFGV